MAKVIAILAPDPHLLFFYLLFVLLPFFQQIFSVHAFAVDTKPPPFPEQTARVAQRHAVLLPSRALDPIHPAFAPHRRLFHACFFCCRVIAREEMMMRERANVTCRGTKVSKRKKKTKRKRTKVQSAYRTTRIPRGSPIVSLSSLLLFWVVKKSSKLYYFLLNSSERKLLSYPHTCVV